MKIVAMRQKAIKWADIGLVVDGKQVRLDGMGDAFFELYYDVEEFKAKYPNEEPFIFEVEG